MRRAAAEIYQDVMDQLSKAVLANDVDAICDRVHLPHTRRTLTAEIVLETQADLEDSARAYAEGLLSQGMDGYVILTSFAEYLIDDYIVGEHVTHALRGATRLFPSFTSRAVLFRADGHWAVSEIDVRSTSPAWPLGQVWMPHDQAVRPYSAPPPGDDARRNAAEPLAIYQRFVDALSAANLAGDFNAYCDLCDFPYTSHSETEDVTLRGPADLRPFFDQLSDQLRRTGADNMERRAKSAAFLCADRICGYHDNRMFRGRDCVNGPVHSRMILKRRGTRWLLSSVTNAVTETQHPYWSFKLSDHLVTLKNIQERTK